jgi:hypothetical protein
MSKTLIHIQRGTDMLSRFNNETLVAAKGLANGLALVFAAAAVAAVSLGMVGNANADFQKTVTVRDDGFSRRVIVRKEFDDGTTVIKRHFTNADGVECRSKTVRDENGSQTFRNCSF